MAKNPRVPLVYVLSDALGETGELLVKAATSQFEPEQVDVRRVPYVTEPSLLEEIVAEAAERDAIVAYTLVGEQMRRSMEEIAARREVVVVDLLGPMLQALSQLSGREPRGEPGILRRLDSDYFRKVEAVEFAVKYDDGKDPRGLLVADVALIGVSRTSKTPVSMYLGHKRVKAANVPLVPEVAPPAEIFSVSARKIVGLTIAPQALYEIRQERLKTLGLGRDADYASYERILRELEYADQVMRRLGCVVIDVTNRAVEETASKILEIIQKGERNDRT